MVRVKGRHVRKLNTLISKNSNKHNTLAQGINTDKIDNNYNQSQVNNKWVINLSKTKLSDGQKSVLAKGPNFSIAPKYIPNVDYITAVESHVFNIKERRCHGS